MHYGYLNDVKKDIPVNIRMSLKEKETLKKISREQGLSQSELVRRSVKLLDSLSKGNWESMRELEIASEIMEEGLREMSDAMFQLLADYGHIALKVRERANKISFDRKRFLDLVKSQQADAIRGQFKPLGLFSDLDQMRPNLLKESKKKREKPKK